MSSALGVLKWSPETLRNATFYEYTAAMKGHLISLGADMTPPMSRDEFLNMKAADEARSKTNEKTNA